MTRPTKPRQGGHYRCMMQFGPKFPRSSPLCWFSPPIVHANSERHHNSCRSAFSLDDWGVNWDEMQATTRDSDGYVAAILLAVQRGLAVPSAAYEPNMGCRFELGPSLRDLVPCSPYRRASRAEILDQAKRHGGRDSAMANWATVRTPSGSAPCCGAGHTCKVSAFSEGAYRNGYWLCDTCVTCRRTHSICSVDSAERSRPRAPEIQAGCSPCFGSPVACAKPIPRVSQPSQVSR